MCGYSQIDLNYGVHWSTITTLNLKAVETRICLELLSLCSNVEKFCSIAPVSSQMQEMELIGNLMIWYHHTRPFHLLHL